MVLHRQNYVLTVLVNRKRRLESCSRQIREVEAKEAGERQQREGGIGQRQTALEKEMRQLLFLLVNYVPCTCTCSMLFLFSLYSQMRLPRAMQWRGGGGGGLERCLAKLTELGLEVGNLITDRHAQVAKWLRENYPNIDHRFDVWHIAKGEFFILQIIYSQLCLSRICWD